MLPFFRKIRYRLARDNQFFNYSRYAIGEIVLVVIGILIALQVNNWNEARKQRKEEIKSLQNLVISLESDINSIAWNLKAFNKTNNSLTLLLDHMERDLPYHDSLNIHFCRLVNRWNPKINTEVFEVLKASNINTVSNDSLKIEILSFYDFADDQFLKFIDRYLKDVEYIGREVYSKRFLEYNANIENVVEELFFSDLSKQNKWIEEYECEVIPIDYEALKKDTEFHYILSGLQVDYKWYIEANLEIAQIRALGLQNFVKKELDKY